MPSAPSLLALRGIGKRFPGVVALDGVDLTVRSGEIHALLGENGAGKSTLIKVLTGVYRPDAGEIILSGRPLQCESPKEAEAAGISTVYQEVNLIPSLSVAENIALGRAPGRLGFINWAAVRRHAREALARLEIVCDVDAELGTLSLALQQMVAVARALDVQARVLVLDEPTASLDEKEVSELFTVLRRLRSSGLGIIFVTHFLEQVYALCDRMTVLRNGCLVGEYVPSALPRLALVGKMLGREILEDRAAENKFERSTEKTPFLLTRGMSRRGGVESVDLELHAGQVTGLAGLLGSGRTETARLLFGVDQPDAGRILVRGKPTRITSPRQAIQLGIAFSSEDRKSEGILPNLSVRENLIVALQAKRGLATTISATEQRALCDHYIQALRIKTSDTETPIRLLSGGNQQKVLLARWLCLRPELIILDEPTRGIDVGAKQEIEQLIERLSREGMAVLFISSEIEEIVRRSSKVVVLRERKFSGELAGGDVNLSRLMKAMAGHEEVR